MNILLTGPPGCGKTTAVLGFLEEYPRKARGFYTSEIRGKRGREGFAIETLGGQSGILAHVSIKGPHRVGKYGVDVESFERLVVPELQLGVDCGCLIVIDEIGKMELLSPVFRRIVESVLDTGRVLATITSKPHPFCDKLKRRPDVKNLVMKGRPDADRIRKFLDEFYVAD